MQTQQFFRRPFDVNAVQVTPENAVEIAQWCKGKVTTAEYKLMGQVVKLPAVLVPGNGPKKGKMVEALIGSWVTEQNMNFRVYRDQQFHEQFNAFVENRPFFKPGDLVQEKDPIDGERQGTVKYVDQVLVDYGMLGTVLHDRDELVWINKYSEQTIKRLKEEAERSGNDGLDKINQLRAEAEAAVMNGSAHQMVGELFEESQPITRIGDFEVGTAVVCREEHAQFFGETGEVINFVNENTMLVQLDYTAEGKRLDPVMFLASELQTMESMKFVLVHSDTSPQQGWVGWVVKDAPVGELVRVAFRSVNPLAKDKCVSFMAHELEEYELSGPVPTYDTEMA